MRFKVSVAVSCFKCSAEYTQNLGHMSPSEAGWIAENLAAMDVPKCGICGDKNPRITVLVSEDKA